MAEHKSYWTQVHLKYADGLEIVQVLDAPTIRRIENGDEELLQQIRRNLEDCGQATQTQPACIEEENVEYEDDQASNSDLEDNQPVSWSRDATELLISLYEEYEQELEDPRKKKKDTWKKTTAALNEAGYKYVQNKVEGKWRSLLASHKDLSLNKKKTGQKRKTFQYFEKIDNIISKRHDINPPFTSGSSLRNQKEAKFTTKLDKNMTGCTSLQTDEDSSTMSYEISSLSPSSTDTADITSDSGKTANAENTETLSKSTTARRRRENRKMNNESNSDYISKLPHHFLEKIFMHVKNIDYYCKLYEVCKEFRKVIYFKRTAFIVHLDALTENSGLKFMPNLKKLFLNRSKH